MLRRRHTLGRWAATTTTAPAGRRSVFPVPSRHPYSATTTTTTTSSPYDATLHNLRIGSHTRVLYQGFAGRQATANAAASIAWGTQVVGGVVPGGGGEHPQLGLPVFPSVKAAVEGCRPDATFVFVAAHQAAAAIEEAVEAEVPLIVAIAEHVPLHDMLRVHALLRTQSRSRLVGANSPGIISAAGRCRIGFQPLSSFSPGVVGVAAKSGTLSYEAVAATTRAGLGQSLCIGVGGDIVSGTDLREALTVLLGDPGTEAVALIGEVGGTGEVEAAEVLREYRSREADPKPVVAVMGGLDVQGRRVMGHAGAFTIRESEGARYKRDELESAGAIIVDHPSKMGEAIRAELDRASALRHSQGSSLGVGQRRGYHTARRLCQRQYTEGAGNAPGPEERLLDTLQGQGIAVSRGSFVEEGPKTLAIGVDRSSRMPCVMVCNKIHIPVDYRAGSTGFEWTPELIEEMAAILASSAATHMAATQAQLPRILDTLMDTFRSEQAFFTKVDLHLPGEADKPPIIVTDAQVQPVPLAPSSPNWTPSPTDDAASIEAAAEGITYIRFPGDARHSIGTLINGAGLAMNAIDALNSAGADDGVQVANFLDTGGRATSETIARCLGWILRDERVRVVFVNVFGGIIRGDMIADGVVAALREVGSRVPLVVRIRGTAEAEGQKVIRESGLEGVYSFDDFEDAARKVIELARNDT